MSPTELRIGIDLGGTKIEGVVLSRKGVILLRERIETPSSRQAILEGVAGIVRRLEAEAREPCSVGIGTPGAISPKTGLLRNSNTTCLNGTPLDRDLEAALGRPVRLANDANCFVLSEASDGAGAGARLVLGLIVGTGTGAGSTARSGAARTPSPASGATTRSPGQATTSARGRCATAASAAASRRG